MAIVARKDIIEAMFRIMRNKNTTNRVIEAAANLIAAETRLQVAIVRSMDRLHWELLGERGLAIIEFGGRLLDECQSAADSFGCGMDEGQLYSLLVDLAQRIHHAESQMNEQ